MENTKGTFKKYIRSRFPSFDPPLPLSSLVRFQNPLSVMTFQIQIYWKDQKTEWLKKMQSLFHSEIFKQGWLH